MTVPETIGGSVPALAPGAVAKEPVGQISRIASVLRPSAAVWVQPVRDTGPRLRQPSPGTWACSVASAPTPGTVIAVTASIGRARFSRTV